MYYTYILVTVHGLRTSGNYFPPAQVVAVNMTCAATLKSFIPRLPWQAVGGNGGREMSGSREIQPVVNSKGENKNRGFTGPGDQVYFLKWNLDGNCQ